MLRRFPAPPLLVAALLPLLLWAAPAVRAQAAPAPLADSLTVAVYEAPPFVMQTGEGEWGGLSVSLLELVAAELGRPLRLVGMPSIDALLAAVEGGEADLGAAALTITLEREQRLDFSHPYHMAGLGIAVPAGQGSSWMLVARRFLSLGFLRLVALWGGVLLLVGFLVWLFERRPNPQFDARSPWRGVLEGFWFSAVTMTTVGYGDKAPLTWGGRLVALVWMFAALVMISSLTAAITSTLTVGAMGGAIQGPGDLAGHRVGTVPGTTSAAYLSARGVASAEFGSVLDALRALERGEVDAVVYDQPLLRHLRQRAALSGVEVLPTTFEPQPYGFALPDGSPLREPLNRAILRITRGDTWQALREARLGR